MISITDALLSPSSQDFLVPIWIRKPTFMPLGLSCCAFSSNAGAYLVVTNIYPDSVASRWNRHVRLKINVGCRIYSINNIANDPLRMQQEIFMAGVLRMQVFQDFTLQEPFDGNTKLTGRRNMILQKNPWWFQFTITLRRLPETPFGLLIRPSVLSNGCCMLLAVTVLRHGLISHWNRRCIITDWESRAILRGDFISDVNGSAGDVFAMLSECTYRTVLRITVRRLLTGISLQECISLECIL